MYIYGAGQDARDVIHQCENADVRVLGVLDDNPERAGEEFEGHKIQSTDSAGNPGPSTPFVITTHRVTPAAERLVKAGITSFFPAWALQILSPDRFQPHMYYADWAEDLVANKDKYIALWELFSDAESRRVYRAFMEFKVRFDPLVLADIVDVPGEYFPEGVLELTDHEILIDGGAWTGDTINVFKEKTGDTFRKVYAFEPSAGTFEKLTENFSDDDRVVPVNKGLYEISTVLKFDDLGSSASRFGDKGTFEVPVTSIDETVGDDAVSLIKMNIEGAEAAALRGGAKTIRRNHPKLAICLYHNPRDLWEIPAVIQEISPAYDFHIRLHDGGVIQLVAYAIPK